MQAAAIKAGILTGDVDMSKAIDGRFVDAAAQVAAARRRRRPSRIGGRMAAATLRRHRRRGLRSRCSSSGGRSPRRGSCCRSSCRRPGRWCAGSASSGPRASSLADLGISLYRITVGFLISTALALPIGVLIGCYRAWEAAIEPLVDFIRYMPVVAFVPLTILWAGPTDTQKFLIIFIGTFFQQVLLFMDNVKSVPREFVDLGRTLEMPERRILQRIVVPSAMPAIWDSMRISLGWAWTWLVVAELVAATSGLGYRITTAQRFFQTDLIFGYLLLLGFLGLATDQAMKLVGPPLLPLPRGAR